MRISTALLGAASVLALTAWPASAQQRELGPHVHGESHLSIVAEGNTIGIELHAPGMDIVGFEYEPTTGDDILAMADAVRKLGDPLQLFGFPAAAGCIVVESEVNLGAHENEEEVAAAPAAAAVPADAEEEGHHSEFDVDYELTCTNIPAIDALTFNFFESFPNASVLDVEMLTDRGPFLFDVGRAAPVVDTRAMF